MIKKIKKILRPIGSPTSYFITRYFISRKFSNRYVNELVTLIEDDKDNPSFFGYYNISSINNDKILICRLKDQEYKESYKKSKISLYIKPIKNMKDSEIHIGDSLAWNWQQGCMLQWLDNENVIYNDYNPIENKYISIIKNINNYETRRLTKPIYAVSKDLNYALTLNFDRLALLRPDYGYFHKLGQSLSNLKEDGIWKIDIKNNTSKLLFSLNDLKNINYKETMNTKLHKVNHIDVSPDSKHFMFLYRWFSNEKKYTRLIVSDSEGKNLKILCGDKMVSHCTWKNNEEIVGFAFNEKYGNKYYKFNIKTGKVELFYPQFLTEDGHPSFDKTGRFFLTDTYPKRDRFSKLLLLDTYKDKFYLLGEFYQPMRYVNSFRVDLHPRFSTDGRYISFDSAHNGIRQQCILNISKIYED